MTEMKDRNSIETDKTDRMQEQYTYVLEMKNNVKPILTSLRVMSIYIIFGLVWILTSDKILENIAKDKEFLAQMQTYKGWFYVFASGVIFFIFTVRFLTLYKISLNEILESYEDLEVAHEEIIAMNTELFEQNNELETQRENILISQQRYELALEGSNDGIWDWDLVSAIYKISQKWKKILGYTDSELPDNVNAWRSICHKDDLLKLDQSVEKYLSDKKGHYESVFRIRNKRGNYLWILSKGKAIWDESGKPIRMAGSHTDITEKIVLSELFNAEKELSEGIIRDAQMIVLVLDKEERIIKYNPYAEKILGYEKEEVIGKNVMKVLLNSNNYNSSHEFFEAVLKGEKTLSNEFEIKCKDGSIRTILWNNNLLHDNEDNVKGVVVIGMDVTEHHNMEEQLRKVAYYDEMTGLPNKALFEIRVTELIKKRTEFAIINVDIDDFKQINDILGHNIGDQIMKSISNALRQVLNRKEEVAARLSGDQYAFIIVDYENESGIHLILKRILEKVRTSWDIGGEQYYVTVTMGVAVFPQNGSDFQELIQKSEIAMYYGKERGKDLYLLFENKMYESTLYNMQMGNQLRQAIKKQEFMLYYQPQYCLDNGEIVGVEALIRWNHPVKGFVSPMEFITFAEKTSQIIQIDEWVLDTAIRQKISWEKKGYKHIKMAVNLSANIIANSDAIKVICSKLEKMDVDFSEIQIEITETAVIEDLEKARLSIEQLKQYGVNIALDDFGTGYSSLTYLKTFPFDVLKIDREFIKDVEESEENMEMCKTIIELAHSLKLVVVAEGIETKEQKKFLSENQCDIGQGYYFSRPVPGEELDTIISKKSQQI